MEFKKKYFNADSLGQATAEELHHGVGPEERDRNQRLQVLVPHEFAILFFPFQFKFDSDQSS